MRSRPTGNMCNHVSGSINSTQTDPHHNLDDNSKDRNSAESASEHNSHSPKKEVKSSDDEEDDKIAESSDTDTDTEDGAYTPYLTIGEQEQRLITLTIMAARAILGPQLYPLPGLDPTNCALKVVTWTAASEGVPYSSLAPMHAAVVERDGEGEGPDDEGGEEKGVRCLWRTPEPRYSRLLALRLLLDTVMEVGRWEEGGPVMRAATGS